jgi:hypothetical protein
MPVHLTLGIAAVRLGMPYYLLYRAARKHPSLPGLIRAGRNYAIADDRIDELKAALVNLGIIKQDLATV